MSEAEVLSSMMRGHESMMAVLTSRHRSLQIIYSLWHNKDLKVRPGNLHFKGITYGKKSRKLRKILSKNTVKINFKEWIYEFKKIYV